MKHGIPPPPFSFWHPKKRTGGGAVQEKKRLARNLRRAQVRLQYGGCSSELPPKPESSAGARRTSSTNRRSPRLYPWRSSLVVIVRSALLASLTLHWSASGKSSRGCPGTPKPTRHPRRGQRFSELLPCSLTARRFFSWTVHGPFSFWQDQKENGGCIPAAKPAPGPAQSPGHRPTTPTAQP